MTGSNALAIALTIVFAITGVGYLARAILGGDTGVGRASDLLHVLMSVAMIAMPWGWTMMFPTTPQIIVFALATLFFVVLAVRRPSEAAATDHHAAHHSGRGSLLFHAVMMASMVLMAVEMSGMGSSGMTMDMPGMTMASGGSGMGVDASAPAWAIIGWLLVAVFAVAALWRLFRTIRPAHGDDIAVRIGSARVNTALLLLMSAGMALAFIPA